MVIDRKAILSLTLMLNDQGGGLDFDGICIVMTACSTFILLILTVPKRNSGSSCALLACKVMEVLFDMDGRCNSKSTGTEPEIISIKIEKLIRGRAQSTEKKRLNNPKMMYTNTHNAQLINHILKPKTILVSSKNTWRFNQMKPRPEITTLK